MISAGAVRTAAFYCVCFSALPVPFFIFGKAGEDDPAAEEGGEAPEEGMVDAGLGSLVDGSRVIGIRRVRRGGLGGVLRAGSGGIAGPIGDGHGGQAHEADADAAFFRGVGENFFLFYGHRPKTGGFQTLSYAYSAAFSCKAITVVYSPTAHAKTRFWQ